MMENSGLCFLKDKERIIDRQRKIKIDIFKTQYPLFRNVAINELGWKIWGKEDQKNDVNIFWADTYVTEELVKRLKPYQRINHFPSSQQLGKKNYLSQNLKRMKVLMPGQYDFFPQTWNIPDQLDQLKDKHQQVFSKQKKKKWYIVKPSSSSQGRGIYLTKDINSVPKQNAIIQEYMCSPCLIDNIKFDLRVYVLIKSLVPLKVFLYDQGLGRLATAKYQYPNKNNKHNLNMHLTNYAINKYSPNYQPNKDIQKDDQGHKRSLSAIFKQLQNNGCDVEQLKNKIDQIIMKTVFAVYPKLLQSYKSCRNIDSQYQSVCFEILGFDILIDEDLKPWIIEVNHSPSFFTDSPLDFVIKKYLILDTFNILNVKSQDREGYLKLSKMKEVKKQQNQNRDRQIARVKRNQEICFENKHLGGFHRIYPDSSKGVYIKILKKMFEKKPKKVKRQEQSSEEFKLIQPANEVIKKPAQNLTLYNKFSHFYNGKNSNLKMRKNESSEEQKRQQQAIKRHLVQRQKKKVSPIKLNSVQINFEQKNSNKSSLQPYDSRRSAAFKEAMMNKSQISSRNITSEAKGRKKDEIREIDTEIRSRIGKMKLARITLQKVKSVDKKNGQDSGTYHSTGLSNFKNQYLNG